MVRFRLIERPSLNQVTFGGGWPRTLHTIRIRFPSRVLFAISDSITARCPKKIHVDLETKYIKSLYNKSMYELYIWYIFKGIKDNKIMSNHFSYCTSLIKYTVICVTNRIVYPHILHVRENIIYTVKTL